MNNSSIGIIGGADGPTQIYVTTHFNWYALAAAILVVAALAVFIIRVIKKRK